MDKFGSRHYYWKGDLVQLRLATESDWETHYTNYFDSENRFFLDGVIELPPDQERAIKSWREFVSPEATHGRTVFAIDNIEGRTVGFINLNQIDERNGTFSISILVDTRDRGKGYGTEAFRMLLRYAFQERRLHKCNSGYVKGNVASQMMHQKLGFQVEGVIRESIYHDGRYWNDIRCGIVQSEFLEREQQPVKKKTL